MSEIIHASTAPHPVGRYPHARRVGNLLLLSGIGPRTPGTNEIPGNVYNAAGRLVDYDIVTQCHSVFANVRAVLEASHCRWDWLVDVTVYLTDMQRDFDQFNQVYAEYFGQIQPTRTTVGVESLPTPISVELKVIASV